MLPIDQLLRELTPQVLRTVVRAASRTGSLPERNYLLTQAARLASS
jgi:hypothetical protein